MSQPVPVVLRRGVTEMVCHRGSGCAEADESTAEWVKFLVEVGGWHQLWDAHEALGNELLHIQSIFGGLVFELSEL